MKKYTKLNWFDKYAGWYALLIAFWLVVLFCGCTTANTQTIEYQVHMGSHHLINANTLEEAQEFIENQSANHAETLTIVYLRED